MRRLALSILTLSVLGCDGGATSPGGSNDDDIDGGALDGSSSSDDDDPDTGAPHRDAGDTEDDEDAGGDGDQGGDGDTDPGTVATTDCKSSPWDEQDFTKVYDVGPGKALATPSDVPWESIGPGTLVRIHAGSAPYRDKWVLNVSGTEEAPVVVRGVPSSTGALPQIRGADAQTRAQLNFWGEERAVIKIGGSNTPDNEEPSHIFVECLDIAGARPGNFYTGDDGNQHEYAQNAAAITIESGDHVTLRNNVFSDSGNGLFSASESSEVRVVGNHIFGNGNVGSIYEHNSYTESAGILFEGNHYGPLCADCPGNNLKDRSAGTVIRYNLIEGANRQLDLVDSDKGLDADPRYHQTFVYGNVLHEAGNFGNSQIVHYGGDSDDGSPDHYRKGTLYFFHNTVVSQRSGNTTLVRLSTAGESLDARNNVIYAMAGGATLAITAGVGTAALWNNFLPTGFKKSHDTLTGSVVDMGTVLGADPGFTNVASGDFTLGESSACIGKAGALAAEAAAHPVLFQMAAPTELIARPVHALVDIGAFER